MVPTTAFPTTEPRNADGRRLPHWPAGLTSPVRGFCATCGSEQGSPVGGLKFAERICWPCWTWGAEILTGFRWVGPREGRA